MNRIRRIVITFLLVISLAVIIHFTSDKTTKEPAAIRAVEVAPPVDGPELKAATPDAAQIKKILTVYCFSDGHNSYELFIREAVEHNFAAELKSGVIVIKVIHADSAEKERLMQMFKPVPPSAFLAVSAGDKTLDWEKLPPGNGENDRENILKAVRAFLVKHFSQ